MIVVPEARDIYIAMVEGIVGSNGGKPGALNGASVLVESILAIDMAVF